MKKIFYKKILCKTMHCKINLIILLILLSISTTNLGIIYNDQTRDTLDQVEGDKNVTPMQKEPTATVFAQYSLSMYSECLSDIAISKMKAPTDNSQDNNCSLSRNDDSEVNINIDLDIQNEDIYDEIIRSFETNEKLSSFYNEYIAKYYPKAYVIRQKFLDMTPEQVAEALNDIVHVFTKEPWFYFQNSPKGFRLIYYWEYVLDQCGIIHDFLKHAKVNLKTKKISFQNGFAWDDFLGYFNYQGDALIPKSQPLLSYLQKNHLISYTAFFALAFDYQVKFFNEGILLKDLNMANKYFSEIEYIFEKLRNTPKEADYYEATKTCKELLGILKKKLCGDSFNNAEKTISDGADDTSNYYKEFTELNDVV